MVPLGHTIMHIFNLIFELAEIHCRYAIDQAVTSAEIAWCDIQIAWCDLKIAFYS